MDAILSQNNPNLFRPKTLLAFIKDLLHLQHELRLLFLIFAPVCSTENVVVKCSPGNIQGLAEFVGIIFLMLSMQCFKNIQSFTQWNLIDKAR